MEYILHLIILSGIYIILSVSLNLLVGYTGILSIAHAAFYGVGAYVVALMALKFHTPFMLNLILAILCSAMLGVLVGIPSLRLRDDYLVIATFAFQIITFSVLNNFTSFTGGPMGLPGIPQPVVFGVSFNTHLSFLILVGIFCFITLWVSFRIIKSPFGRVLKAISEDEIFAQSLGKNISVYKITIFMIGAGLASIAGVMYATYFSFIDPTSFTIMESIFILSIVIIGGSGNLWGSVLGAIILVTLPEILRLIGIPHSIAANMRQIIYGTLLVVFMMYRPQGLIGKFTFKK